MASRKSSTAWSQTSVRLLSVNLGDLADEPGVEALTHGSDGRKSRADFERDTGKDQLLATSSLDRAGYARVVEGVDRRTVNDLDAGQRFDEFGERRTPHAVARRRGNDDRQL